MKQYYIKLITAAVCLIVSFGVNAQTYTAGDITAVPIASLSHDSARCGSIGTLAFQLTIQNSYLGDTVKIVDTLTGTLIAAIGNSTGANPWVLTAPGYLAPYMITDDNLVGGVAYWNYSAFKIVCDTDTIPGIVNHYFLPVSNPCQYGNVSGRVYLDNNADCMYNTGDVALNGIQLTSLAHLYSPTTSLHTDVTTSSATGPYSLTVQESWMSNYTVSMPSLYYFIFPITPCFSGAYNFTTLPQVNADFPLQCGNNLDVECWAGSPCFVRPGRAFYMQPYVSNTGCDSASGQLTLIKDSRVTYNPLLSTHPADTVRGDTLIWNYVNLTNLSGGAYWNSFMTDINLMPDTLVTIGDTLCFRVFTNILSNDIFPGNNNYNICLPVVTAYDPNIKEVSPKGIGANGDIPGTTPLLDYAIHFQNTGTAAAITVNVIDTLDPSVDPTSLRILGTSHHMDPEWLAPNIVKFKFFSVYLPDSLHNEPKSHGYVRFAVKLRSGLPAGTQIRNKGHIYFDYNPAVVTNTALNTIESPTVDTSTTNPDGVITTVIGNVRIYPNPATNSITVENLQDGSIAILNINGSTVLSQYIATPKTTVDISKLPAGVYILKTISKTATTMNKFIKQ